MAGTLGQINNFATQIASLNKQIGLLSASSGGQPPNDLLDQRDQLVGALSKLVGTKVVVQDGGQYNVFIGTGQTLVFNTFSFIAVLIALKAMHPADLMPSPQVRGKGKVREGLAYVKHRPDILLIMFMVFMLGTFGMNFQVSNAVMATAVFGVGAEQFGLMSSASAVGAITAGLLAARRTQIPLRLIVGALAAFTAALALLTFAPNYWFYLLVMVPTGFFSLTVMTAANTSVQLATDPAMRGRVMALYMAPLST